MKIPQRLSWGGITSITERTTRACRGWGNCVAQQKTCCAHSGGNHPNSTSQLCDGFSRIDQLPTKECAGRTRLIRERIYTQTARTILRWIFEDRSDSEEGVCRAHSTDERSGYIPERHVRKREKRAICQQSDPFSRPRQSDHYNPPSTSI